MAEIPRKKFGLGALIEQAKNDPVYQQSLVKTSKSLDETAKAIEYLPATSVQERLRIIFDDSGSMSGRRIINAQDGCVELMRNCNINQVAIAIHPMNPRSIEGSVISKLETMTTNLPELSIAVKKVLATGSTPMYETSQRALAMEPRPSRLIIFSDGSPHDNEIYGKEELITQCQELKIPVDTVLIADHGTQIYQEQLMEEIAKRTGGIYLKFEEGKVNFKDAFKYLSPKLRLKLVADVKMQQALMEGQLT